MGEREMKGERERKRRGSRRNLPGVAIFTLRGRGAWTSAKNTFYSFLSLSLSLFLFLFFSFSLFPASHCIYFTSFSLFPVSYLHLLHLVCKSTAGRKRLEYTHACTTKNKKVKIMSYWLNHDKKKMTNSVNTTMNWDYFVFFFVLLRMIKSVCTVRCPLFLCFVCRK